MAERQTVTVRLNDVQANLLGACQKIEGAGSISDCMRAAINGFVIKKIAEHPELSDFARNLAQVRLEQSLNEISEMFGPDILPRLELPLYIPSVE